MAFFSGYNGVIGSDAAATLDRSVQDHLPYANSNTELLGVSAHLPVSGHFNGNQDPSDGLQACLWPDASLEDFCHRSAESPSKLDTLCFESSHPHLMELDTLAVGDVLCGSALFGGTNWWDSGGLIVPGEDGQLVDELSTLWSFLPAASDNSSPSPTIGSTEEASSVQAIRTTSKNSKIQWASSKDGWVCEYPECNRSFSQRHKLNRHQKYHTKPHRCLEPGCIGRRIAFSLEKDLVRHQSQHNGCRFFCSYVDCSHSIDGLNGGFTRKDNLKRHLTNQHRCL